MTKKDFDKLADLIEKAIEKTGTYNAASYASKAIREGVFKRPTAEYFQDYQDALHAMWHEFYELRYKARG